MEEIVQLFKALAHEKRIKIAALIADRGLSVEEIAAAVELTPATASHHLAVMRAAGLAEATAEGYYTVYRFRAQPLIEALAALAERPAPAAVAEDLERYDHKVLRTYMVDGKLKAIPMQRKKRDVILRYLLNFFEPDRDYPEREVNDIIGAVHEDYATLRRELIDHGWMTRARGIYRRTP